MLLHAPVLVAQGIIPMEDSETEKLKPVEFPCIPPLHPLEFIDSIATPGFVHDRMLNHTKASIRFPCELSL